MSKLDILWREQRGDILKEIELIHEEEGRPGEPDRFGLRNTAARRVYDRLSEDEKARLENATSHKGNNSNPPDIQKKYVPDANGRVLADPDDRRASRYGGQAVSKWAQKQWADMGMVVLTFYGYRGENEQIFSEV